MRRLVCTFVVCQHRRHVFSRQGPNNLLNSIQQASDQTVLEKQSDLGLFNLHMLFLVFGNLALKVNGVLFLLICNMLQFSIHQDIFV